MRIVNAKPYEFEFECRDCGSKLIAEADDVKVGYFGANYGGDSPERQYYVQCPICGTQRVLHENQTTPDVRKSADRTDRRRR